MKNVTRYITTIFILLFIFDYCKGIGTDPSKTNERNLSIIDNQLETEKFKTNEMIPIIPPKINIADANEKNEQQKTYEFDVTNDVEKIQINNLDSSSELEEQFVGFGNNHANIMDFEDDSIVDQPAELASSPIKAHNNNYLGILAAGLGLMCVCLFIGIAMWHKSVHRKYGQRVQLLASDQESCINIGSIDVGETTVYYR